MKKISVMFLMVVFGLALASCVAVPAVAPQSAVGQSLVALPDEGRVLIVSLVTSIFTWLLLQLATVLKMDLSGYVQPITAAVSPIIITLAESWLGTIPPAFDNIVLTVIHLIVLLIGSLGGLLIFRRRSEMKKLLS